MKKTHAPFCVGAADIDFTPAPGLSVMGQMYDRKGVYKHDPLMANAIAFRQGTGTVVVVSIDICVLDEHFVRKTQQRFSRQTGIPACKLILHATHTHVAPGVIPLIGAPVDKGFVESLGKAIVDVASQAVAVLRPAQLYAGQGHLDHIGWNRRAMFKDGSSRMYGNSDADGFIGMEGPRDPTLGVIVARDERGQIISVLVNASTHPNTLEGERFYSADIPGEVRRVLKRLLGERVVVSYMTSASGNTAPSLLYPHVPQQPWRGEAGLIRSGLYLGGETAKVIAAAINPMVSPVLKLQQTVVRIPIRPWPRRGEPHSPDGISREWKDAYAYYQQSKKDWPRRIRTMSPLPVNVNSIRIGDAVICTCPAEFFVEFALDIRRASPARVTVITQLTDGYVGYVPTPKAFGRGGYETWNAPTSQLIPEAGEQIVRATVSQLKKLFPDKR